MKIAPAKPASGKKRMRGWAYAAVLFCILTTLLATADVSISRHLTDAYNHAEFGDSMLFTAGDLLVGGVLMFSSAIASVLTACIAAVAVATAISRKDWVALHLVWLAALVAVVSVGAEAFSDWSCHLAGERSAAADAAEEKSLAEARSDLDLVGQYCNQYAQSHGGDFPPDLAGLSGWTANMHFAGIYHSASLQYYGEGLTNDVYPSPGDLMSYMIASEEVDGSKPMVVGETLSGPALPMGSNSWRAAVQASNAIRTKLGLPPMAP